MKKSSTARAVHLEVEQTLGIHANDLGLSTHSTDRQFGIGAGNH